MRTLIFSLLLSVPALPACAGYEAALKAAVGEVKEQNKELIALLPMSGAELARNARALQLLRENAAALELFRQAAAAPSDGYLLAPKVEEPTVDTAAPVFAPHLRLYRLLLIDAKIAAAGERPGDAEKDLLAAAGFVYQTAAQRSFPVLSHLMTQLTLVEAYPLLQGSLRGGTAAPAYMRELARLLELTAGAQDFMLAAMTDEGEVFKNTFRSVMTKEKMSAEIAKLPFMQRMLMKKLFDEEMLSAADKFVSGVVDGRVKAYAAAFAANDPALAGTLTDRQWQEFQALKAKYPAPGFVKAVKAYLFGDGEVKAAMAYAVAEKFVAVGQPDYSRLIPVYHAAYNVMNVLRAGLAVKRYRRDARKLPDSLERLVPAYLPAVPRDTFSAQAPLVYVKGRKAFAVYSVGPDRADGGGRKALDVKAFRDDPAKNFGDILFFGN